MAWWNTLLDRHGDQLALAGAALIVLLTITLGALAPSGGPHGADAHGTAAGPKMCARYTDGCVLCPTAKYGPGCSTPGPACMRGAWYCAERG